MGLFYQRKINICAKILELRFCTGTYICGSQESVFCLLQDLVALYLLCAVFSITENYTCIQFFRKNELTLNLEIASFTKMPV